MLKLELSGKNRIIAADAPTRDALKRSFFGFQIKDELELRPEEALYLIDMSKAVCAHNGKPVSFYDLSLMFRDMEKFIARYFTYKDWRERGLVAVSKEYNEPNESPIKKYPTSSLRIPHVKIKGTFFKADLMTVVDDEKVGEELYDKYWFGQYGSYKASDKGMLNKLDMFETLFLMENGVLKLENITKDQFLASVESRRGDFESLYGAYKDLREKGYVVKTGFKFGTNFRLYFPGTKPMKAGEGEWTHSKHVIQVFPKNTRLLISEWARAIRVAHSVRKTFILAVPGKAGGSRSDIDYVLYHRHGGDGDNPKNSVPKFAMLSLGEDEYIGSNELSGAINEAKKRKLELLLAIADRETAVTYYKVRRIKLEGGRYDYFEIDWFQP